MRRTLAGIAIAATALTGLAGCAGSDEHSDYARICVDQRTHERVIGDRCGTGDTASNGFLWWYLIYGSTLPRYGAPVTSGTSTLAPSKGYTPLEKAPAGKTYTRPSQNSYKAPPAVAPKAPVSKPVPKPAPGPAPKAPSYKAPAPTYKAPTPTFKAPSTPVRIGK